MQITATPISGHETITDESSPLAALTQFYAAFNNRNMSLMQNNWLQSAEASMSNPLGGVKRGWTDIETVYRKIFQGQAQVYVEFFDYSIHVSASMFIAVGRESGQLQLNNDKIELAIRTSRIYTRQGNQWKQLHHHGSMDNPTLLNRYQQTLLSQ